jgi:hypothetical protein
MNMRMMKIKNISNKFYNFPSKVFGASQNVINYRSESNPQVYFSISQNGINIGKLTFEVIENFYFNLVVC